MLHLLNDLPAKRIGCGDAVIAKRVFVKTAHHGAM
jgi:hypothetical protein